LGNESHVTPEFLHAYLSTPAIREWVSRNAIGATMPNLNTTILSDIPVILPNSSSIQLIGNIWHEINQKITLNRQINQTLEQMAQTLFKSWFVDFDPVIDNALDAGNDIPDTLQERAEQRRLLRAKADFKPLPAETRALFPSEFEETELGWVPKGWDISTTGDEFEVKGGSTPSTANPEFWDEGTIHWTSPKDLSDIDTKILLDTSRKITEAGLKKITSGLLPENTVLMSSRAPVGYLALAKIPVAINQGYIAIPSAKNFTAEYIIQWLDSNMDQIKGMAGGTTFAEISKSTFKTIEILVPTKPVIVEFTKMAKATFDKITSNVKESSYLSNIRDSLLPKLISGELALDDLPEDVAEAAEAL
jgi:type I restriction enzyme S subunit